jgi:hypothetical protein
MVEPKRPSITGAQIAAAVIALIAPVAEALHAFGVFDLSRPQQDALQGLVVALVAFGGVLVAGDAYLRGKRNDAHAKVATAPKTVHETKVYSAGTNPTASAITWTEPRPGVSMTNPVPTPTEADDEPGDPDALPDYETTTNVPPDEGDEEAGAQS